MAQNQNRTACYYRFSSDKQREESIEIQREACHKVAGPDPLEFIDRGVTGTIIARPGFQKMMAAAERGEFDRLLVLRWDRLGRTGLVHGCITELEEMGVAVESVTEGNDSLARGVGLVVSEQYSKTLSQRVKSGLAKHYAKGGFHGASPPYGYASVANTEGRKVLEIEDTEAAVVRHIFDLYLNESIGAKKIATRLNEEGHRTRAKAPWCSSSIAKLLKSTAYIGEMRYRKIKDRRSGRTGQMNRTNRPPSEHIVYRSEDLRIIPQDQWLLVQARMRSRAGDRDYKNRPNLRAFTGRLYCGLCGSVLYCRSSRPDKKGRSYHYYSCGRRQRLGKKYCENATTIREDVLPRISQLTPSALCNR